MTEQRGSTDSSNAVVRIGSQALATRPEPHAYHALRQADGLSRRDSNIPEREVRLRERLANALGLDESALPFVGELIQVREEAVQWRGGIERVLRPFALSLLVDERHHTAVADTINGLDEAEAALYDDLRLGRWGICVRLEQERIAWPRVPAALAADSGDMNP